MAATEWENAHERFCLGRERRPRLRELRVSLPFLTPDEGASFASLYIRLGLPVMPGWRNALNGECEPRPHVMSDPD